MAISNAASGFRPGVCTSTTRPTAPFEGQTIYETDTDMLAIWNGTAWRYIAATTPTNGTVLQVVATTYATQVNTSTTTYADTGLSGTITPKSSSSKILVMINQSTYKNNANSENRVNLRLLRDATTLISSFSGGLHLYNASAINNSAYASVQYLDSPASTSALVYKTQFMNPNGTAQVSCQPDNATSSIVLMEIAA